MSLKYTEVTHESMLTDWNNRILSNEQYKNLSRASIYSYFQELFAGVMDIENYYIQRTAEENYLDTAKLDSSVIKLSHNLGYQPKRAIPAVANIAMVLNGPLPSNLKAGDVIWLNNVKNTFSFNGMNFILDACYSYTLTESDISSGTSSSWSKKIQFAVNGYETQREGYIALDGRIDASSSSNLFPIGVIQGTRVDVEIDPIINSSQVGRAYQFYDIDDISFSNYYGKRDPFANVNGDYNKRYGVCKVGIGKNIDEAFLDENLYEIEDEAVELNTSRDPLTDRKEWNVVCIKSNWDKTARLYFGNGIDSSCGMTSMDSKLFVQYLKTDGSNANYPDAVDSELRSMDKIYASGSGRMINLSNNVSFVFTGPIHGGQDFESKESMKINSKLYFASTGKLITLPDFKSYLNTITDPIIVKHATAFGENQMEENDSEYDSRLNNLVLYSVVSDVYREKDGVVRPINVFDESEDLSGTSLYYDYGTYIDHLFDYVGFMLQPKKYAVSQYSDRSTFGQWCAQIRKSAEDRMLLNTKLLSVPPLFHYYDVVGDILVDRHVDLATFSAELERDLYGWLAKNTTFKSPIYKSDIVKQILSNSGAMRANIDIKVSDWIKGDSKTYRFSPNTVSANVNILVLPRMDIRGNDMSSVFQNMKGHDFTLAVQDNLTEDTQFRIEEISYDLEHVYLSLNKNPTVKSGFYTDVIVESDSFYTKRNLTNLDELMLGDIERWILDKATVTTSDQRPITLPYKISFESELPEHLKEDYNKLKEALAVYAMLPSLNLPASIKNELMSRIMVQLRQQSAIENAVEFYSEKIIREETISRTGANTTDITLNLSEESFYYMLRDNISEDWLTVEDAKKSFRYVYPALKVIFDDNILDDNNNIVNFSSERDMPIVRLMLRYRYA